MASYRQIGRDDETDLQKKLNQKQGELTPATGYSLTSASRGKEQPAQGTTSAPTTPAGGVVGYQESDTVRQAQQMLQEHMAGKPGQYQSTWQSQLDEILGKILNREDFSYDLNGDALYQQYKDQYMLQGQKAMMDTMGQAAALTGGYGNTYAQSVGQQAYQGHLQQLNDRIPELYQLALDKYRMEGDALMDQYALIGARDDQDYGRYRDSVSDYYSELDRLTDSYRDERDYDYGRYADERDYAYGQERDKVADEQWQAEFDEAKRQYDQAWEQKYGSSSGDGGNTSNGGNKPSGGGGSYDADAAKKQQELVDAGYDIAVDGIWGPKSKAAWEDYQNSRGGGADYYEQLLGAVSTAKGAYSKQDYQTRQQTYQESVAAINDAYNRGLITKDQKNELLKIAMPGGR